jgi:hypothetical protein
MGKPVLGAKENNQKEILNIRSMRESLVHVDLVTS